MLRRESVEVAWEESGLAHVACADEPGGPAFEPVPEAAMWRHPVLERLQVALIGFGLAGEGGDVVFVAVKPLVALNTVARAPWGCFARVVRQINGIAVAQTSVPCTATCPEKLGRVWNSWLEPAVNFGRWIGVGGPGACH